MIKYAFAFYLLASMSALLISGTSPVTDDLTKQDSLKADWDKHKAAIIADLGDGINLPTDSVFEDIQNFKGMPAKRLLSVMEFGYSRSLGVGCGHCHDTNNWASSEKPEKQIAREMSAMVKRINGELLTGIDNLKSDQAFVNCTTCHRGDVKPALNME
ncbi:MAG: c-type cytochrome [Cyclobacteriaceae bacterium]